MYYKDVKYTVNEDKGVIELYIYSNRYDRWINLGDIKPTNQGSLIIYFYGDGHTENCVHFTTFDNADEVTYDIMQFIHCEFKFVNNPNDFNELVNSWKLMAEMNRQVKGQ